MDGSGRSTDFGSSKNYWGVESDEGRSVGERNHLLDCVDIDFEVILQFPQSRYEGTVVCLFCIEDRWPTNRGLKGRDLVVYRLEMVEEVHDAGFAVKGCQSCRLFAEPNSACVVDSTAIVAAPSSIDVKRPASAVNRGVKDPFGQWTRKGEKGDPMLWFDGSRRRKRAAWT